MFELGKYERPQERVPTRIIEVWPTDKQSNFEELQLTQAKNIEKCMAQTGKKVIHVGGGHDHIFSFLKAIEKTESNKKMIIINIDAHTDTRTDLLPHSGTPFRQFADTATNDFDLIQLGVRPASNNQKNYSPLNKGQMHCLPFYNHQDLISLERKITALKDKEKENIIILSLDCDGVDLKDIPAVSAPNPYGTPFILMNNLVSRLKDECKYFGVYELNPLVDTHSNTSSKKVAWFLYNYLFGI